MKRALIGWDQDKSHEAGIHDEIEARVPRKQQTFGPGLRSHGGSACKMMQRVGRKLLLVS